MLFVPSSLVEGTLIFDDTALDNHYIYAKAITETMQEYLKYLKEF
jgi:hypothetical protein